MEGSKFVHMLTELGDLADSHVQELEDTQHTEYHKVRRRSVARAEEVRRLRQSFVDGTLSSAHAHDFNDVRPDPTGKRPKTPPPADMLQSASGAASTSFQVGATGALQQAQEVTTKPGEGRGRHSDDADSCDGEKGTRTTRGGTRNDPANASSPSTGQRSGSDTPVAGSGVPIAAPGASATAESATLHNAHPDGSRHSAHPASPGTDDAATPRTGALNVDTTPNGTRTHVYGGFDLAGEATPTTPESAAFAAGAGNGAGAGAGAGNGAGNGAAAGSKSAMGRSASVGDEDSSESDDDGTDNGGMSTMGTVPEGSSGLEDAEMIAATAALEIQFDNMNCSQRSQVVQVAVAWLPCSSLPHSRVA
mgnify:CR=1 FL=1